MNPLHLPSLIAVTTIVSVALSSCNATPSSSPEAALPSPSTQVVTLPATAGAVPAATPVAATPVATNPIATTPAAANPSESNSSVVVTPPTTDCAVKMAIVSDPESPLNVRSSPDSQGNNVVGQVDNNAFVTVIAEQDGWFQIDTPLAGWIAQNRTRYSCALVDEAIDLSPTQNQVLIKGEIIGGGSHQYRINLTAGKTLTIDNEAQVFPRVLAPDDQSLNEDITGTETKQWSTVIPSSGQYIFQLDSNFRGFSYQFSLTIN